MSNAEKDGPPGIIIEYDEGPLVAIVRKYDRISRKLDETEALSRQLDHEIATLSQMGTAAAEKTVETLSVKRLQRDMCPGIIAKMEEELRAIKREMSEPINACANALEQVVRASLESLRKQVVHKLVASGFPEDEARRHADVVDPEVRRAIAIVKQVSSVTCSRADATRLLARLAELRECGTCDVQPKAETMERFMPKGGAK